MYLDFAWRYFRAKKSANAINIIAWVTASVIAFATCCQVLVLSVFNGFEGMVKSLYSSFYTDLKVVPAKGKTFTMDAGMIQKLRQQPYLSQASLVVEEKALLQNGESQSVIQLKGVDDNFINTSGVPGKISKGKFQLGTADDPLIVIGAGIQNAADIIINPDLAPDELTIILPKSHVTGNDPIASLSEGIIKPVGVFAIQQDFDNSYGITNLPFVKQQSGMLENEYTSIDVKLKNGEDMNDCKKSLQELIGKNYSVQTRFQQNSNLYSTMRLEKWAIYAVLTLVLIIAAFTMVSALTMLVLEKKQDIAILQSMGASTLQIKKIFLSEGLLLGGIGAFTGIALAALICVLQLKFKLIKLAGGSFLIDYFPVKLVATDFLLVTGTSLAIAFIASWFPAYKASKQPLELR